MSESIKLTDKERWDLIAEGKRVAEALRVTGLSGAADTMERLTQLALGDEAFRGYASMSDALHYFDAHAKLERQRREGDL